MSNLIKKKSYRFLLFLQIFFVQYCYAQQTDRDSLFNRFRNDVQDELFSNNGRVVWDDETDASYYLLMSSLPIESLLKYTDDSIPAVRARIFAGLAQKGADESLLKDIMNNHLNDTALFIDAATDAVQSWTAKGYMQLTYDLKVNGNMSKVDFQARLNKVREKKKDLHIIMPGVRHNVISKRDLFKIDSLVCSDDGFRILSFELYTRKKTLKSSYVISKKMKKAFRKLKAKDWILIEEIECLCPDKIKRKLSSLRLRIR